MSNYNTVERKEPYYLKIWAKYLISDPAYQRTVDMNRVKRIVSEFNPNLVNPIKVSRRGGQYYVFDGQHTLSALKMVYGAKGNFKVNCLVYEGLTQKEEAELFAEQTGISRKVKANAKFKALCVAGNEEIIRWKNVTEHMGVKMDFSEGKARYKIVACTKAYRIWNNTTEREYREILEIIIKAWNGEAESFNTEILGGVYEFYKQYKGQFKKEILSKQLSKVSPMYIIREGKLSSIGADKRFAKQIAYAYNKNLRSNRINFGDLEV